MMRSTGRSSRCASVIVECAQCEGLRLGLRKSDLGTATTPAAEFTREVKTARAVARDHGPCPRSPAAAIPSARTVS
jgi:hypothetical protein